MKLVEKKPNLKRKKSVEKRAESLLIFMRSSLLSESYIKNGLP